MTVLITSVQLFKESPINFFTVAVNRLRGFTLLLKLKIICGKRVKCKFFRCSRKKNGEITCKNKGRIDIGKIKLDTNAALQVLEGNLSIGDNLGINRNSVVACRYSITIGKDCNIGPNVCIYDHDYTFGKDGLISNKFNCSEIIIGDNCWIGAGTIILRGTHIGRNSVIGAGSVVKGDIPKGSLVTSERRLIVKSLKDGSLRESVGKK